MFKNLIQRLNSIKPPSVTAVGIAVVTVEVGVPVPLAISKPSDHHCDHMGRCVYGRWDAPEKRWVWGIQSRPYANDTHWISAHAEALPETCFKPEATNANA
jgi:hypothetical protein